MLLLPDLAVALQRGVWMRLQLGNETGLQGSELLGGSTGNRSYGEISRLPSLLEIPFERGS